MCYVADLDRNELGLYVENEKTTPHITEANIVCYKVLDREFLWKKFKFQYTSIHYKFVWQFFKQYFLGKKLEQKQSNYTYIVISEGFHSFTNLFSHKNYKTLSDKAQYVVQCLIPKGSTYYFDGYEYVSDSIMIVQKIKKA